MFPELKEMPKCQDGRVCKGNNNGFMFVEFESGFKFVCGDCYLQARKDFEKNKLKEAVKEILKELKDDKS